MSSKCKFLAIALAFFTILGLWAATSKADVTGSWAVRLSLDPIQCQYLDPVHRIIGFPDQPCEKTIWKMDFETNLNINITVSGLTLGLHAHAGVTGFEDFILSFATTLGALEIRDLFIFAQPYATVLICSAVGPDGVCDDDTGDVVINSIPTCIVDFDGVCNTLFVKKRVDMSIALGGVTFTNLAMFEDVTFPQYCFETPGLLPLEFTLNVPREDSFPFFVNAGCVLANLKGIDVPSNYEAQSQTFGFGDVITLSGQTPSGITVTSITGICAEQLANTIKKHGWAFKVDEDCIGNENVAKPPFFFSFEKLFIEGIPLASDLTLDVAVECGSIFGSAEIGAFFPCVAAPTITITGGPIFNTISLTTAVQNPLGSSSVSGVNVRAAGGPVLFIGQFGGTTCDIATLCGFLLQANFTLNPDTNPASLRIRLLRNFQVFFPFLNPALTPGFEGLLAFSFADFRLTVRRAGLTFFADLDLDFNAGPPATFNFDDLHMGVTAEAGVVTVQGEVFIEEGGTDPESSFMLGSNIQLTVNF